MNLSSIIVLASVIAGALAIPFLNDPTFDILNSYDESLEPILNDSITSTEAKKYPGSVKRSLGPNLYTYTSDTAFGELNIEISNTDILTVKQKLVNPEATLEFLLENNGILTETWTFTTQTYTLVSFKNYTTSSETFSTHDGSCTKMLVNGQAQESCSGQLYNIEDKWNIARTKMREYMTKLETAVQKLELTDIRDDEWDV
jgi:hypothetical protein